MHISQFDKLLLKMNDNVIANNYLKIKKITGTAAASGVNYADHTYENHIVS